MNVSNVHTWARESKNELRFDLGLNMNAAPK